MAEILPDSGQSLVSVSVSASLALSSVFTLVFFILPQSLAQVVSIQVQSLSLPLCLSASLSIPAQLCACQFSQFS